jgi:hypothetical protein
MADVYNFISLLLHYRHLAVTWAVLPENCRKSASPCWRSVAAKLKRFGIEQPATDFFFWVIEQIPQEA